MADQLARDTAGAERPRADGRPAQARDAARGEVRLTAALFAAALGYATLRYNVFKGVPWTDWPAYTVNKALAVASVLMVAATVVRLCTRGKRTSVLMAAAGVLALVHSLLSFAMLNPGYYPRLFEAGKLTFSGGLSLTLGAAVMAVMELGARGSGNWPQALRHRALAVVALGGGVHAALPAVATWLEPSTWPGGLPPLTLISFLAGSLGLLAWRRRSF